MTGPFADRLFRIAFVLAGVYNLAFGLWAAFWPQAFFHVFEIASPRYPGIWACVGMIVGVYGLLYWHVAWKLETGWPIIAVGLLGKILGPIGMIASFSDDWPRRLGMLCVYNDLIWWLPFGLYLVRGTRFGRWIASSAPWLCVFVHAAALAMLGIFLHQGTQTNTDLLSRAAYVGAHPILWSIGWATWMMAAASLVGFYAWWGRHLSSAAESTNALAETWVATICISAVVIAAIGMAFDFTGEGSGILRLVETVPSATDTGSLAAWDSQPFLRVESDFRHCSAGAANGLYTIGGIALTLLTTGLPTWVRRLMWATWLAGIVMTITAISNQLFGMVLSTAILFPLFLIWVAYMGARWRPA